MQIASGVGLRQCARNLGLTLRSTQLKFRKIARHLRRLNLNLRDQLSTNASFHFDEFETYEGQRNTRPLSVPMLIESNSRFIVWAESATIRPRGKMSGKRLKRLAESEQRHGIRKDRSRRSIERTLRRGADMANHSETVTLKSDEKLSYPRLAKAVYGKKRLKHLKTNSRLARETWNPLFAINNEEAIMRDLMGRLRRESWLVSKKRRYLDLALQVHMAYRNLVRKRFNRDQQSPAQLLGFLPRRLRPLELLSWRQDWSERSIHPASPTGVSVGTWKLRSLVAA